MTTLVFDSSNSDLRLSWTVFASSNAFCKSSFNWVAFIASTFNLATSLAKLSPNSLALANSAPILPISSSFAVTVASKSLFEFSRRDNWFLAKSTSDCLMSRLLRKAFNCSFNSSMRLFVSIVLTLSVSKSLALFSAAKARRVSLSSCFNWEYPFSSFPFSKIYLAWALSNSLAWEAATSLRLLYLSSSRLIFTFKLSLSALISVIFSVLAFILLKACFNSASNLPMSRSWPLIVASFVATALSSALTCEASESFMVLNLAMLWFASITFWRSIWVLFSCSTSPCCMSFNSIRILEAVSSPSLMALARLPLHLSTSAWDVNNCRCASAMRSAWNFSCSCKDEISMPCLALEASSSLLFSFNSLTTFSRRATLSLSTFNASDKSFFSFCSAASSTCRCSLSAYSTATRCSSSIMVLLFSSSALLISFKRDFATANASVESLRSLLMDVTSDLTTSNSFTPASILCSAVFKFSFVLSKSFCDFAAFAAFSSANFLYWAQRLSRVVMFSDWATACSSKSPLRLSMTSPLSLFSFSSCFWRSLSDLYLAL